MKKLTYGRAKKHPKIKPESWWAPLPVEAYGPDGYPYVRVRLRHPSKPLYYRQNHWSYEEPWVAMGYDTYEVKTWVARFGASAGMDGRKWEFYGETIEIWDSNPDE